MTGDTKGPPGWHQEFYIGGGYPYYRPNFLLTPAILWFVITFSILAWAVIVKRRAKREDRPSSVVREILTWKNGYWTAVLCIFLTAGFAIIDDEILVATDNIQQVYFIYQFLFNSFDYLAQIFLLSTVYALLFQLIRWSSLGSKWLSGKYFWRFMMLRFGVCIALGVILVVLEAMSLAYLKGLVFSPQGSGTDATDGLGYATWNVYLVFGVLYWVAALEILVVSGHMLRVQRRHRSGNQKVCVFLISL